MEHEAWGGGTAVEDVAEDWAAEAALLGWGCRVDPELVGSSGLGNKLDAPGVFFSGHFPAVGLCGFSPQVIHNLERPSVDVEAQGEVDGCVLRGWLAFDERDVSLSHLPRLELH